MRPAPLATLNRARSWPRPDSTNGKRNLVEQIRFRLKRWYKLRLQLNATWNCLKRGTTSNIWVVYFEPVFTMYRNTKSASDATALGCQLDVMDDVINAPWSKQNDPVRAPTIREASAESRLNRDMGHRHNKADTQIDSIWEKMGQGTSIVYAFTSKMYGDNRTADRCSDEHDTFPI